MTSDSPQLPPRLYAIVAREAPVAVVFRRGPSKWWHIMKWDLANDAIEHGAWIKAKVRPEYSSISPDGRLLCYWVRQGWEDDEHEWHTCFIVSKVPWLTALCAWDTFGDPRGGSHFCRNNKIALSGVRSKRPFHGHFRGSVTCRLAPKTRREHGWIRPPLRVRVAERFVVGGVEIAGAGLSLLVKRQPPGRSLLRRVCGSAYSIETEDRVIHMLNDVAWADWDHAGRLVVATDDGVLQVRDPAQGPDAIVWQYDLRDLKPDPQPSPEWARQW